VHRYDTLWTVLVVGPGEPAGSGDKWIRTHGFEEVMAFSATEFGGSDVL